jgi:hypothetical protein
VVECGSLENCCTFGYREFESHPLRNGCLLTMKSAEETYNEVAAKLAAEHGIAISQMFGMPALKIKGKAFAGFSNDTMIFKLTGEPHTKALAEPGANLFEPMAGRPMKEWVQVPLSTSKKWEAFANDAMNYVSKLKK